MRLVYGHVDVCVRDLGRARTFYDRLCAELRLTEIDETPEWCVHLPKTGNFPMLLLCADPQHHANETRGSFRSASPR
jgi:hypothetical protein